MKILSALEAREAFLEGRLRAQDMVEAHLEEIDKHNDSVNAFIHVTRQEALDKAKALDQALEEGKDLGPLAGIVISLKDNISYKGVPMTCGSKMLENYIPPYDAEIVDKLKAADAIIIGKTNLDEFAMGSDTKTSHFGVTRNPANLDLVAGGSSGGAAASVAAHMCQLAIGTDTGGSVRQPAGLCGIVGMKPSYGSISRHGIAPMANSFDQVGVLGQNVEDVAYLLSILEGRDPKDASSTGNPSLSKEAIDQAKDLKDLKVAVPAFYLDFDLEDSVREGYQKVINFLKDHGAQVEEVDLATLPHTVECYYALINAEVTSNMSRYDGIIYGYRAEDYDNLDDFYTKTRSQGFGSEVKRRIMLGAYLTSMDEEEGYYKKAVTLRKQMIKEFEALFKDYDLLLSPTSPMSGFGVDHDLSPTEIYMSDMFTPPVNLAGLAGISVPVEALGKVVGVQFISDKFKDAQALKTAGDYERKMSHGI
ncbi:MAG: Asp-tRNA(Asn)/Glu-tRNA(Gln) amidotransferase subunit GatA [Tissierellia bacterium]|nr:Asp-tRNA(Asn)/Glu-tRNA(Gln) amidotransferase subunit GatA [Tissierellia bacterium]